MKRVDLGRIQEWSINQAMRGERFGECSRKKGEFSGMRKFQRLDVDNEMVSVAVKACDGQENVQILSLLSDFNY